MWGTVAVRNETMGYPTETHDYTLLCTVVSIPNLEAAPRVIWLDDNGQEITKESHVNITVGDPVISGDIVISKLIFTYLRSSHGGKYSCKAILRIEGLNSVPPLVDTYNLVVISK